MNKANKILAGILIFAILCVYIEYRRVHAQQAGSYNSNGTTAPTGSCPSGSIFQLSPTVAPLSPLFYACGSDSNWYGPYAQAPYVGYNWSVTPGLFSTTTALSAIYWFPQGATIYNVTARITGSPICVAAPTVVILDLGTVPTTSYGSATILQSLATGTSNGAFTTGTISKAVTAGHYVGFGLSAGSCVTPPQLDTTMTVQ
jgi:hypothetical protein